MSTSNAERVPSRPFGRWEVEAIVEARGDGQETVRKRPIPQNALPELWPFLPTPLLDKDTQPRLTKITAVEGNTQSPLTSARNLLQPRQRSPWRDWSRFLSSAGFRDARMTNAVYLDPRPHYSSALPPFSLRDMSHLRTAIAGAGPGWTCACPHSPSRWNSFY